MRLGGSGLARKHDGFSGDCRALRERDEARRDMLASGLCVQPTIDIAFRTFIRYMSTNTVIANIHAAFLLVFPIT